MRFTLSQVSGSYPGCLTLPLYQLVCLGVSYPWHVLTWVCLSLCASYLLCALPFVSLLMVCLTLGFILVLILRWVRLSLLPLVTLILGRLTFGDLPLTVLPLVILTLDCLTFGVSSPA